MIIITRLRKVREDDDYPPTMYEAPNQYIYEAKSTEGNVDMVFGAADDSVAFEYVQMISTDLTPFFEPICFHDPVAYQPCKSVICP